MRPLVLLALIAACSQHDQPPARQVVAEKPAEAANTLPLSICIETLGGISTPLLARGTKLPISHSEVFSTSEDDQASVEIHVLQGERPLAKDNRSLGKFQLRGIPPAPRGVPQIVVTFAIDEHDVLSVSARDKVTGEQREIKIEGGNSSVLANGEVEKILAETRAKAAEDDKLRAWSESRVKLTNLLLQGNQLLVNVGERLSQATRKRWHDELARAETVMATTAEPGDPKLVVAALASLQQALRDGSEELYTNAK